MRVLPVLLLLASLSAGPVQAQFFRDLFRNVGRGFNNFIRPVMNMFHAPVGNRFNSGSNNIGPNGGTREPVATGIDNPFPDDCGRDQDKNTGLLCFPDGLLCQQSESFFSSYDSKNGRTDGQTNKQAGSTEQFSRLFCVCCESMHALKFYLIPSSKITYCG